MTLEELQEIIQSLREVSAELTHVEVKRAGRGLPRRLWETLSAFANTPGGGVIILGVDEESGLQVTSVPVPARLQSDLASLCDQMEPPLRPLIQVHTLEGQPVVVAEVPEVPHTQKPCHYRGAGLMTGSFIRVADGDRRLSQYEIQVFLDNRGQPTYDLDPVAARCRDDLDPVLLDAFIARLRARPDAPYRDWDRQRLLQVFRVLVEHEGRLVPSLAGYLCLGVYPQDVFPSLHLAVVRYPTSRPGEVSERGERLLDNVKAEGPLVALLRQGMNAILRNLQRRAVVQGLFRRDVWEYPLEALREALVNALAHRDYSPLARGTPVQVRIFPDRLEVENPGGLFGPVTVERLGEPGLLATRNAHLMRLLEDLPAEDGRVMCENRGTGITAMLGMLRAAGMEPPRFDDRRTTFRLTFSNASLLDVVQSREPYRLSVEHEEVSVDHVPKSAELPPRAQPHQVRSVILSLCSTEPLSSRELGQRLGRSQTYLLNRYLSPLVAEGLLERVGTAPTDPNLRYHTTERGRIWLKTYGDDAE